MNELLDQIFLTNKRMVRIKICGITTLEDAMASVEAGADALGFNFYPKSPRYIEPAEARRIIEQLPAAVLNVGVFVNEEVEEVQRIAAEVGLGAVQLHGDEPAPYCRKLRDLFVIKALRVNAEFEPEQAVAYETDAILLDGFSPHAYGGSGRKVDWAIAIQTRPLVAKLFLAGGLNVENVAAAISAVQPYAVDACSGLESAPGLKDVSKVRAFIKAAREAGSSASNDVR